MTQTLKQGENTSLNAAAGRVTVKHQAGNSIDVNLTAFLVTDTGKVVDDTGMVFFNQPSHASGAATFTPPTASGNDLTHSVAFNLASLPANITKIAITLTQDGAASGFAAVQGLTASIQAGDQMIELAPSGFDKESGIIALELYTRNGQWKARAVWQGFASGLAGLCQMYGIEVESEPSSAPAPAPTPAPAPAPAPAKVELKKSFVSLAKPTEKHRVSLVKGDDAPKFIKVSATWVDNGDGRDNDDLDLRIGILRPDGSMSIIQAPERSGDFDKAPYVLHCGDVTTASVDEPATESVHINPKISHLMGGPVALVCSVYSAVANGAVSVASLKPRMRMEYGPQVVECAFEFKAGFGSSMVYTYVLGIIEINGDEVTIQPSGATSKMMSEATPWLTRQGEKVTMTINGPAVFKGEPLKPQGGKRYV